MTPTYETLTVALNEHIALIELNRANKANALNAVMWRELEESFRWADTIADVRVIVLAAQGKHFCSGLDLSMFNELVEGETEAARKAEKLRITIKQLQGNLNAIEQCRKPVLAAIHSSCIGGGVDMVCCCDMRYCTRDAHFSIKEIDMGMTADVGTLQRLPKLISDGMTRELAFTGRKVNAQEALRLGLVNHVYDDREQLLEEVMGIASLIASKSPIAVRGVKEMLLYSRDHSVIDSLNYVATWNAGMLSVEDVLKSVDAQQQNKQADYED